MFSSCRLQTLKGHELDRVPPDPPRPLLLDPAALRPPGPALLSRHLPLLALLVHLLFFHLVKTSHENDRSQ